MTNIRRRFVRAALIVLTPMLIAGCGINTIPTKDEKAKAAWAEVQNQYQRRADQIPNLVETVKGYAGHESSVLTEVTRARAGVVAAANDPSATTVQRATAENALSNALVNLRATAEAYPDLKADSNFMDLQNKLSELEQKIAYARQFYNDVVLKFNTSIEKVPTNIIAGMFHFTQAQYFEAADSDRSVPQVKF